MAIKRVVIHLGTAKAGSTSIQRTLFTNSVILERNGFRYLTEWGESHIRFFENLFSPDPVRPLNNYYGPLMTEEERQDCIKTITDTMLQVVNTTNCETLVLSGEYWGGLVRDSIIANVKEFIKNYFISRGVEVTIFYLVRNPLTWIISAEQQALFGGFYSTYDDFYKDQMDTYYKAVYNLQKHFSDSLILLKFEDAVNDKDGLVGCFLKTIGFPQEEIHNMNILKVNESHCMEAVEFINYIEDIESFLPFGNEEFVNPNRYLFDLNPLYGIKGAKFDLPYRSKLELWDRFGEIVRLLKINTGIDYTDYKIPLPTEQETYSEKTILGFIEAFPKLSPILQKHFLRFFEKKYAETGHVKFRRLYFQNSVPRLLYNALPEEKKRSAEETEKILLTNENAGLNNLLQSVIRERDAMLNSRSWRITKPLRKIKAALKRVAGR